MADEREPGGEQERPVAPPIIDLEAEEVRGEGETGSSGAADGSESSSSDATRRPWLSLPWAMMAALAIVIIAAGGWAAYTLRSPSQPEAADSRLNQRLGALEAASEQTLARVGELAVLMNEMRSQPQQMQSDPAELEALKQQMSEFDGRIGTLSEAIGSIGTSLNELKAQPPQQAQSNPAELEALKQQMSEFDGRIGALSEAIGGIGTSLKAIESGQGAQQKEIEATAQRLGEIQSRLSAEPASRTAESDTTDGIAAALVKLKAASAEGRPFAEELQALAALSPEIGSVDALEAHAARGVAATADLSVQLQDAIVALKTPAAKVTAAGDKGVWDLLKAKAAALISIRRLDDAKWLEAAEDAAVQLTAGDVAGAVNRLRSVPGNPPPSLAAWLEAAEARLAIDRVMEDISAEVVRKLGGGA